MLTSSGINANVALLSTVGGPGDVLLVDAHAHASVHAGCRRQPGHGAAASGTTTWPRWSGGWPGSTRGPAQSSSSTASTR